MVPKGSQHPSQSTRICRPNETQLLLDSNGELSGGRGVTTPGIDRFKRLVRAGGFVTVERWDCGSMSERLDATWTEVMFGELLVEAAMDSGIVTKQSMDVSLCEPRASVGRAITCY